MSEDAGIGFTYRLPVTMIRVAGTRTTTTDSLTKAAVVEVKALATTEIAADWRTRIRVRPTLDPDSQAEISWKLTPDGRLVEAMKNTSVSRLAPWAPALRVGAFALAAVLPALIPGPAGLLASAGALAGAAEVEKKVRRRGVAESDADVVTEDPVLTAYVKAAEHDAKVLLGLRRSMARALEAQATVLDDADPSSAVALGSLRNASRVVDLLRPSLERAEAAFRAWRARQLTTSVEDFDRSFPIDALPSRASLTDWCQQGAGDADWMSFARQWGVAVSIDLESHDEQAAPTVAEPPALYDPGTVRDEVVWRPPRRVVKRVWRLDQNDKGVRSLTKLSEQPVDAAVPGNEQILPLGSRRASRQVKAAFSETGALTEIGATLTGERRQSATEWTGLTSDVAAAAESGTKLRDALALPTLAEQVAARENLAKLAPPPPEDPQKATERKALEAAQQKAQLRIAEQLALATSPPQVIVFGTPAP